MHHPFAQPPQPIKISLSFLTWFWKHSLEHWKWLSTSTLKWLDALICDQDIWPFLFCMSLLSSGTWRDPSLLSDIWPVDASSSLVGKKTHLGTVPRVTKWAWRGRLEPMKFCSNLFVTEIVPHSSTQPQLVQPRSFHYDVFESEAFVSNFAVSLFHFPCQRFDRR